ncbi:MAG: hypothetical protein R2710_27770 [Acidimicrobiales bacterium]
MTSSSAADLIVNHVSSASAPFLDWQQAQWLGITVRRHVPDPKRGFSGGPDDPDIDKLYRPRPGRPFTAYEIAGREQQVWTTFTSDQVDIDVNSPAGRDHLLGVLDRFAAAGIDLVRLDAVGYAIKKPGSSSFMIPETFEFIDWITEQSRTRGMGVLVEIHAHHRHQIEIADRVDAVYDFALPPLVLHALHTGDAAPLEEWLRIAPRNCVTVLDTHDGIGIVDVAPEGELDGLLSAQQVDELVETMHEASGGRSREATGAAASNLDLYQVNTTFYEALASEDEAHFVARLIQVLCPGIPQVYYAGLLAAPNQMELLHRTKVGRDINRPYYSDEGLAAAMQTDVVIDTLGLLRWRNCNADLFEGSFDVLDSPSGVLAFRWTRGDDVLEATIDVTRRSFRLEIGESVFTSPADFRRSDRFR